MHPYPLSKYIPCRVTHQPDHQLALLGNPRIDDRMLEVFRLPTLIGKNEVDLRVGLRPRIDLARPFLDHIELRLRGGGSDGERHREDG